MGAQASGKSIGTRSKQKKSRHFRWVPQLILPDLI
jgi:hypothetical protein